MAIPTEGNTTVMIDSNSIVVNPTSKLDIPQAVTLSQVLTRDTTIDGTAMSSIRVIEADDSSGLAIFSTEASYSATDGRQCRIFVFNTDSSDYVSLDISANGYVKLTNAYFIVDTPVQSGHATNKSYVDSSISTAKTELEEYTDSSVSTVKSELEEYTDTSINTAKTQLEAYADTVSGKNITIDKTSTSITLSELKGGDLYDYGTLSSLTINSVEQSYYECSIYFTSGNTATTLQYPSTLGVVGNIEIIANKQYVLSICNNIMVIGEVN